ncbi:Eaa protein [Salmonella enterica]|nr:Eaa protein [Salmonella enterica]EEF4032265.1 Eaa protein [Salmonella enterica]EEL9689882.1 Eaa protein [Salmonella enterica]EEU3912422.1 Eaa protein [Salmonella enterica]EGY4506568.1 Eaa protein [Salmonella enterica]
MTTITKERIELFIKSPLENGLTRGEQMELARIALVSLDAELVAWTDEEELRDLRKVGFCEMFSVEPISKDSDMLRVIPLYRHAQPTPVVPDYASFEEFWSSFEHPFAEDDELKSFAVEIWNACRSAMLNGGKS